MYDFVSFYVQKVSRSFVPPSYLILATPLERIYKTCLAVAEMGDRLTATDMSRKWGLLCPFPWGGAGSPSNTMSSGPSPSSVPSGILIHPTVWPQYTNVRQTGQTGHWSCSIRRTVTCNGRPKTFCTHLNVSRNYLSL